MSLLLIIPQAWAERYAELPSGWWATHGEGLQRVWPQAPEVIDQVARAVGIDPRLLVTRMELEQSAISYAWDGSTWDYGRRDSMKLRYLCGVDKTDSGPRKDGWFGPGLQAYGCAVRFRFLYRGESMPEEILARTGPLPRDVRGLSEDPAFAAGVSVARSGRTITPANQASADCLRYTTNLQAADNLRAIGLRWFPADYEAEEGGRKTGKMIVLHAGHYGHEGGASYGSADEATLNYSIRNKLGDLLKAEGHDVRYVPYTLGGPKRYSDQGVWAAAQGAEVFVAIHHDAGGGSGSTGIIDHEEAIEGRKLAKTLAASCASALGIPDRGWAYYLGSPGHHLGVLSGGDNWDVTRAACLIECAFVDGDYDLVRQDSYPARAAKALARGIYAYLGLPTPAPWLDAPATAPAPDPETPSAWAADAWAWATENDLMHGDPHGPATRETLAVLLDRYDKMKGTTR